jgi:hypothetical protein
MGIRKEIKTKKNIIKHEKKNVKRNSMNKYKDSLCHQKICNKILSLPLSVIARLLE